ncbi:hypothetical protein GMOD_00008330 [Pyrenophora seminiperda CCB06]|uniref:Uncharacterized protein n=1 Tax=Pyrenophora seminiperda CCB06 TaxID=1302712 RepID=A0A3M7M298_9PLEO|nr:hypothetical protein GMOD_00008330 [Pyrenophora seminiperda CCB06]
MLLVDRSPRTARVAVGGSSVVGPEWPFFCASSLPRPYAKKQPVDWVKISASLAHECAHTWPTALHLLLLTASTLPAPCSKEEGSRARQKLNPHGSYTGAMSYEQSQPVPICESSHSIDCSSRKLLCSPC